MAKDIARGLLTKAASVDDARRLVESSWANHEVQAEHLLMSQWEPATPPPPTEWPGFHLVRARTIRRAMRRFGARHPTTSSTGTAIIETTLTASDAGLRGRPDRVEGAPGRRCVVDLKTALSQRGPTESQRLQLLLYCHLVAATTGDMPTHVAIEDASGTRWEERTSEAEVHDMVARVVAARQTYEATPVHDLAAAASPSADTCRRCVYRPVCAPYWRALETTWEHGSVAGTVVEIRSNPRASTVVVDADSPIDAAGEEWLVTAMPPQVGIDIGPTTAVDAELTGAPRHLRWRWSTLTWTPSAKPRT